jgi:DNA modification methylase
MKKPYILKIGDQLTLLKKLSKTSVDLIITYCENPLDKKIITALSRSLKPNGTIILVTTSTNYFNICFPFIEKGLVLYDTMIHRYYPGQPVSLKYSQAFDFIFIFTKGEYPKTINLIKSNGKKPKNGNGYNDVHENIWQYDSRQAIPVDLMTDMILSFSHEGATVLDPFLNTGVSGIAAMSLNRKFIGLDTNETRLDIAKKRIENWQKETNDQYFSDDLYEGLDF